MSRRLPVVTTLVACAIGLPGVALLTGCGGGIPDDAIAKVGDTNISKASYDDSLKYQEMAASQQVTNNTLFKSATPKLVEFKAPFTDCKQRILAVVPAAQKAQATDAVLQQACQAVPKAVKDSAIQQVLSAAVLGMEAKDEKVTVSDAEVNAQLNAAYTSQIGGKANLGKFEKLTGLKPDVFTDLVKQGLLLQKMQTKAVNAAGPVTDADVQKYYNDNKAKLGAESREVHVVLASSEANANAAKQELANGATFASVAQKYSIDATTKADGGKLTQVIKGQRDAAFEQAAFSTAATQVSAPVKGSAGWYVVRVDKITPARNVAFADVQAAIKQQLAQTKPQESAEKWQEMVVKKWKAKTDCKKGYDTATFCKNAPTTTTTATTGS